MQERPGGGWAEACRSAQVGLRLEVSLSSANRCYKRVGNRACASLRRSHPRKGAMLGPDDRNVGTQHAGQDKPANEENVGASLDSCSLLRGVLPRFPQFVVVHRIDKHYARMGSPVGWEMLGGHQLDFGEARFRHRPSGVEAKRCGVTPRSGGAKRQPRGALCI